MKRLIPFLVLLAGTAGAFAQGIVYFNNNNLPADRIQRNPDGTPLLGSDFTAPASFVAQLYWSTDSGNSFTAIPLLQRGLDRRELIRLERGWAATGRFPPVSVGLALPFSSRLEPGIRPAAL